MTTTLFILFILFLTAGSVYITAVMHDINNSRTPRCVCDAIKMCFLPYVILKMRTEKGRESFKS